MPKLSAANDKFLKKIREEFGYEDISVRDVGKSLWIYLPVKKRIVDIKASAKAPKTTTEISDKITVRHVSANLNNDQLSLDYDIQKSKTYQKDPGYGSNYSDEYQKAQQEIMQVLSQVYFDFAETVRLGSPHPEDPKDLPEVPNFLVITVADIEKGLELESIFYFKDLQKAMSMIPSLTGDEFLKRYVADVRGDPAIVDDKQGKHLKYRDIDMREFLSRQIENRVNITYNRPSSSGRDKAPETIRDNVLLAISDALQAYQYFNVTDVKLKDLAQNPSAEETLSKNDLMAFINAHTWKEPRGRVINIKFGL